MGELVSAVIVGTGFSGVDDFVILERAADVGGTWRSRQFAPQPDIWAYLRRCAEKYGILPHIRYNANVVASRFDEATSTWVVWRGPFVPIESQVQYALDAILAFRYRQATRSFKPGDYLVKAK